MPTTVKIVGFDQVLGEVLPENPVCVAALAGQITRVFRGAGFGAGHIFHDWPFVASLAFRA